MSESKRTAEPWGIVEIGDGQHAQLTYRGVAAMMLKHDHSTEGMANAARIVACVNGCVGVNPAAVAGLVEALRFLLREYDQHIPATEMCSDIRRAADAARAALALAAT